MSNYVIAFILLVFLFVKDGQWQADKDALQAIIDNPASAVQIAQEALSK